MLRVVGVLLVVATTAAAGPTNGKLQIHYLDVGQGAGASYCLQNECPWLVMQVLNSVFQQAAPHAG